MSADRPTAPDDLEGDALLCWHRLCDDLEAAGHLNTADRSVIALTARIEAGHLLAARHVGQWGPILPAHNKTIGRSPWASYMLDTAKQLATLYTLLGLTPAARKFDRRVVADEPADLELD